MPLATNPKKTLPVWLECDAGIPEDERPTFETRFFTSYEIDEIADELDAIPTLTDGGEARIRMDAVLARGIFGWRNMTEPGKDGKPVPIDFAPDRFGRVLTPSEKWDLGYRMIQAPRLTEADAKKSSSSATSTPDSSAPGVVGESAAKTS